MTGLVGPDGSEKAPIVLGTALVPIAKGVLLWPSMVRDRQGPLGLPWRPVAGEDIEPGDQIVLRGAKAWRSG